MNFPALVVRTARAWILPLQMLLLALAISGALAWILTGVFGGVPFLGALALVLFILTSLEGTR